MRFTLFTCCWFREGWDFAICQINEERALLGITVNRWDRRVYIDLLWHEFKF
jgi:hypothetical protein